MERVNHIDIVKVGGCRLIGKVYGVLQRQVPNREGFKLSVACLDSPLLLMIKLRKADSHFTAAGAGCGYNYKRTGSFNVIIFAVAVIADNKLNILRVIINFIVLIDLNAETLKLFFEGSRRGLSRKLSHNNTADFKSEALVNVHKTKHIKVICNAYIAPDLIFFNVICIYGNYHFSVVFKL